MKYRVACSEAVKKTKDLIRLKAGGGIEEIDHSTQGKCKELISSPASDNRFKCFGFYLIFFMGKIQFKQASRLAEVHAGQMS